MGHSIHLKTSTVIRSISPIWTKLLFRLQNRRKAIWIRRTTFSKKLSWKMKLKIFVEASLAPTLTNFCHNNPHLRNPKVPQTSINTKMRATPPHLIVTRTNFSWVGASRCHKLKLKRASTVALVKTNMTAWRIRAIVKPLNTQKSLQWISTNSLNQARLRTVKPPSQVLVQWCSKWARITPSN